MTLLYVDNQLSQYHLLKRLFFPHSMVLAMAIVEQWTMGSLLKITWP